MELVWTWLPSLFKYIKNRVLDFIIFHYFYKLYLINKSYYRKSVDIKKNIYPESTPTATNPANPANPANPEPVTGNQPINININMPNTQPVIQPTAEQLSVSPGHDSSSSVPSYVPSPNPYGPNDSDSPSLLDTQAPENEENKKVTTSEDNTSGGTKKIIL